MTGIPMTEAQFQRRIMDYCQLRGLLLFHDTDSRKNNPGFPDLVIVGPNRVLFRELKTQTGRISPKQEGWLLALQHAGQDATVWRPSDWVDRIVPQLNSLTVAKARAGR